MFAMVTPPYVWEAFDFEIPLFGISKTVVSKLLAGPQPGSSLETPPKNQ